MPPKANSLATLPPNLVKRIVELGGKNELRRPRTTDVPKTGVHPDDPPMMFFDGLGWYEIPQREVHTYAEQGQILDNAAAYIRRVSNTPPKYNSSSTSIGVNNDMKHVSKLVPVPTPVQVPVPVPVPKAKAKAKPKAKPKAKAKAKAKAGY